MASSRRGGVPRVARSPMSRSRRPSTSRTASSSRWLNTGPSPYAPGCEGAERGHIRCMPSFRPPAQAANGDFIAEGTETVSEGPDAGKLVPPAPEDAGRDPQSATPPAPEATPSPPPVPGAHDEPALASPSAGAPPRAAGSPAAIRAEGACPGPATAAPAPPPEPIVPGAPVVPAASAPRRGQAQASARAPARRGPAPWPPRVSDTLALSPPKPRLALPPPKLRPQDPIALGAAAPAAAPPATGDVSSAPGTPPPISAPPEPCAPSTPAASDPGAPQAAPSEGIPPPASGRAVSPARPRPQHANPTWPLEPVPAPEAASQPAPASQSVARPPRAGAPARAAVVALAPAVPAAAPPGGPAPAPKDAVLPLRAPTPAPPAAPAAPVPAAPPAPPAQPHNLEARAHPLAPGLDPPGDQRGAVSAPAPQVAASSETAAAAERLWQPLPVPVFPHHRAGEPGPPATQARSLPVWQETPAPPLAPRRATWTPPAGVDVRLRPILVRALKLIGLAAMGFVLSVAALIVLYRWVDPPTSMLMLGQRLGGSSITQHWLALEHVSSNLQLAVVASEDGRFCRHHGVDWGELESAIDQSVDGVARGGSTIAMQTVKNLFLWPAKSYVRKAIEIPLAYAVDATWSKRRLLEIYLNIAEWGPGIFGAEAAARYHFRKPASLLSPREAALLAVSLPNPFERRAGAPGPGTQRLAANLMLRMRAAPGMARCVRSGSGL